MIVSVCFQARPRPAPGPHKGSRLSCPKWVTGRGYADACNLRDFKAQGLHCSSPGAIPATAEHMLIHTGGAALATRDLAVTGDLRQKEGARSHRNGVADA